MTARRAAPAAVPLRDRGPATPTRGPARPGRPGWPPIDIKGPRAQAREMRAHAMQERQWTRMLRENSPEIRERAVAWRRQDAMVRIERPTRLQRARRLGYRAKQGIAVVRMRVGTGGMRRQRPRGGRRPKHLGVTRIKGDDSLKVVAQRRVLERYPNMSLLGSYFVYRDGMHCWYEVILADPEHPRISRDTELFGRLYANPQRGAGHRPEDAAQDQAETAGA